MAFNLTHQIRIASGTNVIAALWLIISPYGFGYHLLNPPFWNSVAVGMAVAFFAIIRLAMPFRFPELSWINALLGAWLVLSPFLLGFTEVEPAFWNSVLVGFLLAAMAAWSVVVGREGESLLK